MVTQLQILSISLTLGRFGACADAVFRAVDLLSLHHNVLETLVVRVETVLQQLTESHRAAGKKRNKQRRQKFEICGEGGEKEETVSGF